MCMSSSLRQISLAIRHDSRGVLSREAFEGGSICTNSKCSRSCIDNPVPVIEIVDIVARLRK
jgi:hypothetical protein